ncbi:hypothetical protein IWQ62_000287 [Dispira parvispora]|uniref:Uncharacterized protein n=1 Tax=Dispira parvispora TaxID=1520584 RepID=A0A9W8B0H6_9FUNG|nr:hypothetical protein IWQ62_000287 [Dispira parvispora]
MFQDRTARLWDMRTHRSVKAIQGFANPDILNTGDDEINQIILDNRSRHLAIADDSGCPKLYDTRSHRLVWRAPQGHTNLCVSAAFSPANPHELWTGGLDAAQIQWNITAKTMVTCCADDTTTGDHSDGGNAAQICNPPFVYSLAYHPDGHQIVAGLGNGCIRVLEAESPTNHKSTKRTQRSTSSRKHAQHTPLPEWHERPALREGHGYIVSALNFLDNIHLVSAGVDGQLALWKSSTTGPSGNNIASRRAKSQPATMNQSPYKLQGTFPTLFDKIECTATVLAPTSWVAVGGMSSYPGTQGVIGLYRCTEL